jgi:hypothetical protein
MMPIQIVLVIFCLLALARVVARFRAKDVSVGSLLVWAGVFLAALIVVVVPEVASQSAKLLGVGRGADLVVYISLFILFFTVFRLVVALERAKRDITTLTRELALKNSDTKV